MVRLGHDLVGIEAEGKISRCDIGARIGKINLGYEAISGTAKRIEVC